MVLSPEWEIRSYRTRIRVTGIISQDGESWFVGSRRYLANWCQTSEKSVTNNLQKLLGKGLIRKRRKVVHGCTFNDYQAVPLPSTPGKKVPLTGEESSLDTGEESSPHTLEDSHTSSEEARIPFSEIIDYLNEKAGTRYRSQTPKTREHIRARWSDGYRLNDFKRVVDVKCADWLGDEKMGRYLCPDTLFGPKFEKYRNQPTPASLRAVLADFSSYDLSNKSSSQKITTEISDAYDWSGTDEIRF